MTRPIWLRRIHFLSVFASMLTVSRTRMEVEGFRDGSMDPLHIGAASDVARGHLCALIGSVVSR